MPAEPPGYSVALLHDYLSEVELNPDLSPTTIAKYRQCLTTFATWLDRRPISPQAARAFLADLRTHAYSPRSIQLYYHAIKPFLEYQGIPFKLKFKRPRQLPQYHSRQDLESMLQAIDARTDSWSRNKARDRLILLMLAFTGLRASELLNLRPCDITPDFILVRRGKGGKDRAIPLSQVLRQPLAEHIASNRIKPTDSLFPFQRKRLYTIVKQYAVAAGITDLTPHSLRHQFATRLLEQGAPITAVQALLGHADISTTAVYLDLLPSHLQSAIALLDESGSVSSIPDSKKCKSKRLSLSLSNERHGGTPGETSKVRVHSSECAFPPPPPEYGRQEERQCSGSGSKRERASMPASTSHPSRASPNTGPGRGASSASARDAPTASQASPHDGVTRPASSLTTSRRPGNSETKS
ncbi:MAG: tyrosine-type recombinase/integrase [Dehalococcoidia bacterium]